MEIVLKKGREKSLKNRHPWIFSGALETKPQCKPGQIASVRSSDGEQMGYAYINTNCDIIGRMISFSADADPVEAVRENVRKAIAFRRELFGDFSGQAIRLIHAEADDLPGLVVDLYDKSVVIQSATAGMDALKESILQVLISELNPAWIYEKSNSASRKVEKCDMVQKTLFGSAVDPVLIDENGITHIVPIEKGQKSGFFIDQREMRSLIRRISLGKKVLNCFSYTGGFSLAALKGGAESCTSVDCSEDALAILNENIRRNSLEASSHTSVCADCFSYLRSDPLDFDLIVLDPPAFAKKRSDIPQASKGYRDINLQVMKKVKSGTLLLTASCSYYMDTATFKKVLFQAAQASGRQVQILSHHIHAFDHPESLYVPETSYLKSYLLRIV